MSSPEPPGTEDAYQAFLANLDHERERRLDRYDPVRLAWLVLPPSWTASVADEIGFTGWRELIEQAETEGVCRRSPPVDLDRPEWFAVEVDVRLATFLAPAVRAALPGRVATVPDEQARARLLVSLSAPSDEPHRLELLTLAQRMADPTARVRALSALAPQLPEPERTTATGQALADARLVDDPGDRATMLLLVAPTMTASGAQSVGREVLGLLPGIALEADRSRTLTRVAPFVPQGEIGAAVALARQFRAADCRARPVSALARRLPVPDAVEILRTELAGLRDQPGRSDVTVATRTLTRELATLGELGLASQGARTIENAEGRKHALISLAAATAGSPAEAVALAEDAAYSGPPEERNLIDMHRLAQRLVRRNGVTAEPVARRAVRESLPEADQAGRPAPTAAVLAETLATAAEIDPPSATEEQTREALARISDLDDPAERLGLLRRLLAAPIDPELRRELTARAVTAARAIADVGERTEALIGLASRIDEPVRAEVVAEARELASARPDDFSFWTPDAVRTEILERLHKPTLFQVAGQVALGLQAAAPSMPLTRAVERWARLAAMATLDGTDAAAAWLDRTIQELAARRDTTGALAWIATAQLLVPVLGRALDSVVGLGRRRVELMHRQVLDRRQLHRFLPRQGQIDDLHSLVGDQEHWALHYLGVGGVGKTMLIRHLAASVAPALGAAIARIDFDHLNPDYPVRKPGQLLLELMDELQPYAPAGSYDDIASALRSGVALLHDVVAASARTEQLERQRDAALEAVRAAFIDFLRILPEPVVLVLDTCEELAKAQVGDGRMPAVEATFDLLELLHDAVPSLRVVLAGRRLLARSGAGWTAPGAPSALPAKKEYLRLHEVRGFDHDEALRFLGHSERVPPADLVTAILRHSTELEPAKQVVREDGPRPRPGGGGRRYSPFDLNLYATWYDEDRTLTAALLDSATIDPYVDMRIVRRLPRRDVRRLLPAVALLGRFDRSMLRSAHDGSDESFEVAFVELSQQEWIEFQPGETTFLQVDRNLRPRLLKYFAPPDENVDDVDAARAIRRQELVAAQQALAAGLAALVRGRPVLEIDVDLLDAAMRLLPPGEATALWDDVARRGRAAANWTWAEERVRRLLGDEGAVADPAHPARAAVRAALIASLTHTRPDYDPGPDWDEVAERAHQHPDPVIRAWLAHRATAGRVAASTPPTALESTAFRHLLELFPALPDDAATELVEQLTASCCAALEARVELAETFADPILLGDLDEVAAAWVDRIRPTAPVELHALAGMLVVRMSALRGEHRAAARRALDLARNSAVPVSGPDGWADWRSPEDSRCRLRLELIRWSTRCPLTAPETVLDAELVASWPPRTADDLDADRLTSAALAWQWSRAPAATDGLPMSMVGGVVVRTCHITTPPASVTTARILAEAGEVNRALDLLNRVRRAAGVRGDGLTERATERAELDVRRRLRLPAVAAADTLAASPDPADRNAAWPLIVLCEPDDRVLPATDGAYLDDHESWRHHRPSGLERNRVAERLPLAMRRLDLWHTLDDLRALFDVREAELMDPPRRWWGWWRRRPAPSFAGVDPDRLARDPRATAEDVFRQLLRMRALYPETVGGVSTDALLGVYAPRIGRRRMAELAFEEGELLALRLPDHATAILDIGATWFREADDAQAALLADIAAAMAAIRGRRLDRQGAWDRYDSLRQSLDRAGQRPPGGWPARLDACLDWLHGDQPAGRGDPALRPREMQFPKPAFGGGRSLSDWKRRIRTTAGAIGLAAFALAVLGGAALLAYAAYRSVQDGGSRANVAIIAAVVAASGASYLAAGFDTVLHRLARRLMWRRDSAALRLSPFAPSRDDGTGVILLRSPTPHWRALSRVLRSDAWRSDRVHGLGLPVDSWIVPSGDLHLPARSHRALARVVRDAGGRRIAVSVSAPRTSQDEPFEQRLAGWFPSSATERLDFTRHLGRRVGRTPRTDRRVVLVADPDVCRFAEEAWTPTLPVVASARSYLPGKVDPALVVHIVGRPVRTRSRVTLKIEAPEDHVRSDQELRRSVRGEHLVEADDLIRTGSPILIVQGVPTSARLGGETTAREAAELRLFAAQACDEGVALVVSVPPLSEHLARVVVSLLARAVSSSGDAHQPVDLPAAVWAVNLIRLAIGKERGAAAWDVSLFHRPWAGESEPR